MSKGMNGTAKAGITMALVATVAIAIGGVIMSAENAVLIIGFCSVVSTSLLGLLKSIGTDQKLDVVADKAVVAAHDKAVADEKLRQETVNAAAKVAVKVEQVKEALTEKDVATNQKLDKIHLLVNSGYGVVLKSNMELARWKADQTDKQEDREAATKAEQDYKSHQGGQARVDAKEVQDLK